MNFQINLAYMWFVVYSSAFAVLNFGGIFLVHKRKMPLKFGQVWMHLEHLDAFGRVWTRLDAFGQGLDKCG